MTTSTIQNKIVAEPSLKDVLDMHKRDIGLSFNFCALATIQSFDGDSQTVTASINYTKTFSRPNARGIYAPVQVNYPLLLDCPVFILQGGDAALTMPIAVGDTCVILFNDRDMDNWLDSGQIGPVATQRLHSFSDGIAFIGIRSFQNPISDYDADRAVLKNGTTKVAVGSEKIEVSNETLNLNTLLQTLITDLQTLTTQLALLTVTCATPGNPSSVPINAALITAVGTSLGTLGTQIGGLLE